MWRRLLATGVLGIFVGATVVWVLSQRGSSHAGPGQAPLQESQSPIDVSSPATPRKVNEPSVDAPTPVVAARTSLEEIVSNADDFGRNAGLYSLLASTGRRDVEALLADVETLAPAHHRYDVSRVLYTRFAGIDPAAAADHVVAANYHSSWVAAVFRAWAHTDLDAAVGRAATLEGDAKAIAAGAILELDLPAMLQEDIAKKLDSAITLAVVEARKALAGGEKDFASAWEAALRVGDGQQRLGHMRMLALAWAGEDPIEAMDAITDMEDTDTAMVLRAAVLEVWAADDPVAAIRWLSDQQRGRDPRFEWLARILMRELVDAGVAEAIIALDTMPAHLEERARVGLVSALRGRKASDLDFQMVLDWYASLESESRELTTW